MMNHEEAILKLSRDPIYKQRIYDSYLCGNMIQNCVRYFDSIEFNETLKLIKNLKLGSDFLEIGAGPGFASIAFSKSGFNVTALELDSSNILGVGAIKCSQIQNNVYINLIHSSGNSLPFSDSIFDIIYFRQSLHHMMHSGVVLLEANRVLKSGGIILAMREHVVSNSRQLCFFLKKHPVHRLCGGEYAYTLKYYKSRLLEAGFERILILKPFSSPINYYPFSESELKYEIAKRLRFRSLKKIFLILANRAYISTMIFKVMNILVRRPGRNYSFIFKKP